MQTITDFFWNLGAWNWFIVAAAMALLETVIPGVHFMWFGIAAVVMGFLILAVPMPFAYQLVLFATLSLVAIYFARRYWAPQDLVTDNPDLNNRGQQYVGRTVTVVEPIENGRGKVSVGDTVWPAEGADKPAGTTVKVTGVKGTVLQVG